MSDAFYLGRVYDLEKRTLTDKPVEYDPADLTTHGLVTGMTGSGKTGLCVALLEEAALQGIPALIIDPKGDLTNLLLHFPELLPSDFLPWIDLEAARRSGQPVEQVAAQTAVTWEKGLGEWGIAKERIRALANAAQFAVFTPGSDAGLPVSILASLAAPNMPWEGNREIIRERISATATALLGLVGQTDVDPLRSREHILLSNIFEAAWSQGHNLDLTELILQTQTPPFDKLGAFPLDKFFPEKDRNTLAMLLNNILAAPAFEVWREGQPLDIPSLLYAPDGRPRHSIFYLAHLGDAERMFFVTLLFSAFETWMRTQPGSASLRAILYMDEIFGYLPPTANPPSKQPLLRMLKQARAFGVGILLATQNPVDVDYKALSNCGTWFVGKLQTDQDKQRLLDGLESAAGGMDRAAYDRIISSLGKRVFLMHNVHEKGPTILQTRWVMNFLAGPMTRAQIPDLNRLVGARIEPSAPAAVASPAASPAAPAPAPTPAAVPSAPAPVAAAATQGGSATRPAIPATVAEFFLPLNLSLTEAFRAAGTAAPADAHQTGVLYRPALLASAQVRLLDRKLGVDAELTRAFLIPNPDRRGVIRWEDHPVRSAPFPRPDPAPAPQARFAPLDLPLSDAKLMAALQKDFADWLYRTLRVTARANEALKVYAGPDISQADFMRACAEAAREARDAETAKTLATLDRKIAALKDKIAREERELRQDEEELAARRMEEMGTHAENVISLLSGRRATRRVSSSLTKRRLTSAAKADVEESQQAIAQYQAELAALEKEREQAAAEINERWGAVVNQVSEVTVTPKKTDIYVDMFGVAWVPYYQVQSSAGTLEIPAFGQG